MAGILFFDHDTMLHILCVDTVWGAVERSCNATHKRLFADKLLQDCITPACGGCVTAPGGVFHRRGWSRFDVGSAG